MPSRAKVKRCAESLQRHFPSVAGHYCFRNQKTFSVQRGPARLARGASHPGCGSQRLLRPLVRASHPAGRGPNSSSLFPPLAAVVAVAPSTNAPNSPIIKSSQRKAVSPCVSFTSPTCIWASGSANSPCWTTSDTF